jgi:hypothetical protein
LELRITIRNKQERNMENRKYRIKGKCDNKKEIPGKMKNKIS